MSEPVKKTTSTFPTMANPKDKSDKWISNWKNLAPEVQDETIERFAKQNYISSQSVEVTPKGLQRSDIGFEGRAMAIGEDSKPFYLSSAEEKRKANADLLRATLEDYSNTTGRASNEVFNNLNFVSQRLNPGKPSGLEEPYDEDYRKANTQSWAADFAESLYEGLVVNTIEGVGNLIPTVAQAFGSSEDEMKDDWTTNWITAVSGFTD